MGAKELAVFIEWPDSILDVSIENLAKKITKRRKEKEAVSLKTSQKESYFVTTLLFLEKIEYTGKSNYEI